VTRVAALAFVLLLVGGAGSAGGRSAQDGFQADLVRAVKISSSPGGVLLISNGSRSWLGAVGLAVRRPRAPMRVDRRFRIASVTKTFTATIVLRLVDAGKLSLDDTVERWLPGRVPGGGSITIRQLLNHTSGLLDGASESGAPGVFAYANGNYELLAAVVEGVEGRGIAASMREWLIQPLRLRDTVWPTRSSVPRLAHGYSRYTGADVTLVKPKALTAAGGLVSSATDVARFLRAVLGGSVLSRAQRAEMQTPVPVTERGWDGYGLGLVEVETTCGTAWGHRGRGFGFTSYGFGSADGRRVAVLLLNVETDLNVAANVQRLLLAAWCRS
jgi:D-alanyl-D-alanine carboxypeptidase